jgi:hypothetical protein
VVLFKASIDWSVKALYKSISIFTRLFHKLVRNNRKKGHNLIDDPYINGETYSGKENVLQGFTEHFRQLATNNCSPALMICSMVMLYISADFPVLMDLILFSNSDNVATGIALFLTRFYFPVIKTGQAIIYWQSRIQYNVDSLKDHHP